MDTKHKYIRLRQYNSFIIFPQTIKHSEFKHYDIVSAGFCHVDASQRKVVCFGESTSLKLVSAEADTELASKQIFGWD